MLWALGLAGLLLACGAAPASAHAPAATPEIAPDDALPATLLGVRVSIQASAVPTARAADDEPVDRWWARDKFRHVTYSFLWTLSTQFVLESKANWSSRDALPASIGSAFLAGLGKELYDWQLGPRRHFSWRDMAANGVGIALGTGVILL